MMNQIRLVVAKPSVVTSPMRMFCINHTKANPKPLRAGKNGIALLHDPLWSKGISFDFEERDRLGMRGLLPPVVRPLAVQVKRNLAIIRGMKSNMEKNLHLQNLHNRNETLYHRLLVDHLEEIAPLIYTPTVGEVCQNFGSQYNRSRGMYFTRADRGMFGTMVYNWPHNDVHVIVVTDGSRILGLGDLGAHGMGIPIGKLALYCAAGGIAPHRVLPVVLDVGTNNEELLADPDYVGVRQPRLEGDEYFSLCDEFMTAVFERWPGVVVQFEDFATPKAIALLDRYRHLRVFNDDIQGTGCVTLAGLLSAARNAKTSINDMKFLCAGAGSAGLGVCSQIVDGMVEAGGMSKEEAMQSFVICTSQGALGANDDAHGSPNYKRGLQDERVPWVNNSVSDGASLLEVVKRTRPTVLLGLSAQPDVFTEEIVRTMARQCKEDGVRPIIMPMSNPTSKCECSAEQAYTWTDGEAVVATGSPFDPVTLADGRTFTPSQCNNMYVFPGIGLAASVAGVTRITDKMFYVAAVACMNAMTPEEQAEGRTFPQLSRIRDVSHAVAVAVVEEAIAAGLATKISKEHVQSGLSDFISSKMYFPSYHPLLGARDSNTHR